MNIVSSLHRYGTNAHARFHDSVIVRCVVALVLFTVPAGLFTELAENIITKEVYPFDRALLQAVHQLSASWLDSIVRLATNLGGTLFVPGITMLIFLWCWHKQYVSQGLLVLLSVSGASVINVVLKLAFARSRPDLWTHLVSEQTYSFPSGHAVASMSLAASIIAVLWFSRWRNLALCIGLFYIVLIAFTRLYAGVHYPTDVIGGWLLALAWTGIVTIILDASSRHRRSRPAIQPRSPGPQP